MPPEPAETVEYAPRQYWTEVARRVRTRGHGRTLAGDDTPYLRYVREKFLRTLLPRLPVGGRKVLELGSGPGGNLRALERQAPALRVGCDISEEMVAIARESVGASSTAWFVVADGRSLPFRAGAFDLAFTVTVLQHNDDRAMEDMVGELCRVSATDVVAFEDVGQHGYRDRTYAVRRPDEYAACFRRNGFRSVAANPLRVGATYRLGSVIRAAFRRRRYAEGEPAPALARTVEAATLPLARLLDGIVPQRAGLVAMAFTRSPSSG